jgi:hypothetical protein
MTGGDQADLPAEDALQHRADERIVRAAEDDRVDIRLAQRLAIGARLLDHGLRERESALDDRREVRGRDLGDGELAVLRGKRAQIRTALDGRRRRQHADPPTLGDRGRDLGLGLDHRDHLDAGRRAQFPGDFQPGPGRRVAGDDDQFRPPVEQKADVSLDALFELRGGLRPIREAGVVAEVEEVLLGQGDEALVQDREAADAGVKDGNRQRCVAGRGHAAGV